MIIVICTFTIVSQPPSRYEDFAYVPCERLFKKDWPYVDLGRRKTDLEIAANDGNRKTSG
jgi:hypothetical protein